MSKEAEEEILKLIRAKPEIYTSLYVHGTHATPGEILLLLEELGYRKLPEVERKRAEFKTAFLPEEG